MNKLQANACLFAITFFAGIQYAFLKNIPASVSDFLFLFITNVIGFLIGMLCLGSELRRADRRQVLCSMVLAGLLLGYHVFMLLGASSLDTTVTSFVLTSYIIFVPLVSLFFRKRVKKEQLAGMILVLAGLALSMGVNLSAFWNPSMGYLLIADVFFALYIVMSGQCAGEMNPAVLTLGQLFFGSVFSMLGWVWQSGGALPDIPSDLGFWASVWFVAFFIRGMYSLVQLYAQRYVSALQVSLIFSTEIIVTLLMAPVLSRLFGTEPEAVRGQNVAGCMVILCGVLVADGTLGNILKRKIHAKGEKSYGMG